MLAKKKRYSVFHFNHFQEKDFYLGVKFQSAIFPKLPERKRGCLYSTQLYLKYMSKVKSMNFSLISLSERT